MQVSLYSEALVVGTQRCFVPFSPLFTSKCLCGIPYVAADCPNKDNVGRCAHTAAVQVLTCLLTLNNP
jgi:hypothetical protein